MGSPAKSSRQRIRDSRVFEPMDDVVRRKYHADPARHRRAPQVRWEQKRDCGNFGMTDETRANVIAQGCLKPIPARLLIGKWHSKLGSDDPRRTSSQLAALGYRCIAQTLESGVEFVRCHVYASDDIPPRRRMRSAIQAPSVPNSEWHSVEPIVSACSRRKVKWRNLRPAVHQLDPVLAVQ
jgi:hypothetical protein